MKNIDEARKLLELVSGKMEEPSEPHLTEEVPKSNVWELPELSYGQNPEVPSFSSAINLVHSNQFGRHLVANRNINTGMINIFLIFLYIFAFYY
jgi:hypothetical protein